jgi:hypothetical protein
MHAKTYTAQSLGDTKSTDLCLSLSLSLPILERSPGIEQLCMYTHAQPCMSFSTWQPKPLQQYKAAKHQLTHTHTHINIASSPTGALDICVSRLHTSLKMHIEQTLRLNCSTSPSCFPVRVHRASQDRQGTLCQCSSSEKARFLTS